MPADDADDPGRIITADSLLDAAEHAFLRADAARVLPLLRRIEGEFGPPTDIRPAARYATLRAATAARAGNWAQAARRCANPSALQKANTGVVHALALGAVRRLGEANGHAEPEPAALAVVLWAHLLDTEDPGGFRALLTARRGTPIDDDLWADARDRLVKRITELLHALDIHAGRDILAAWETAWEAQRVAPVILLPQVGPEGLLTLPYAARHLVEQGRGLALLDAYTNRHPDLGRWTAESRDHAPCAGSVARALAERGLRRVQARDWQDALTDFTRAARLGLTLDPEHLEAVSRAGRNVGRSLTGRDYSPIARIQGLELAYALRPDDDALSGELTAELARQGRHVFDNDPRQSKNRFVRALEVSPGDPDAQSGLDDHLRADLCTALDPDAPPKHLRAPRVRDLLERDPECALARRWLVDHYADKAVADAICGRLRRARSAVGEMIHCDGQVDFWDEDFVDRSLVDLLLDETRRPSNLETRAALELRVDLLNAAVRIATPDQADIRTELHAAVVRLAEHLDTNATSPDIIELFDRGFLPLGVSARFDRILTAAYVGRATLRAREGNPAGARRDRKAAALITRGLEVRNPPYEPDTGQETLF